MEVYTENYADHKGVIYNLKYLIQTQILDLITPNIKFIFEN